jgi:glycosyltransferase involved in cell wall biosynthesis
MDKVDILWMKCAYPLPLDSGTKKRTFNLLKHSRDSLTTTFLSFDPRPEDAERAGLGQYVHREVTLLRPPERKRGLGFYLRVLSNMGTPHPYFIKRNASLDMQDRLRQLFRDQDFDALVCDGLDIAFNVDFSLPVPRILLAHDVETSLWRQRYETARGMIHRAYFNYEAKRMAAFETEMSNKFDLIIAVSEQDKHQLETEFNVRVPIEVIETGVDCRFFAPNPDVAVVPKRLVFTGSQDLFSNIDGLLWFAAEVLPIVRRSHPEVSLDIVGPSPAAEIRALARKDKAIRVTGWVEDVRPYIAAAEVFVVPLRAPGGTRLKIYEAMGMKKPVVSTGHGAEGLPVAHGTHLLIADRANDFAQAIIRLLDDETLRTTIGQSGSRMVNERYDWSVITQRFVELVKHLVGSSKRT